MSPEQTAIVAALQAFIANPSSRPLCVDPDGLANIWRFMVLHYPHRLHQDIVDLTDFDFGATQWYRIRSYQPGREESAIQFHRSRFLGSVFEDSDLRRSDFSNAFLQHFTVKKSNLMQCNFHSATYAGAILWQDSTLTDIDAISYQLSSAKLHETATRNITFQCCQFFIFSRSNNLNEQGLPSLTSLQNTTMVAPWMTGIAPLCNAPWYQTLCRFFTERGVSLWYPPYFCDDSSSSNDCPRTSPPNYTISTAKQLLATKQPITVSRRIRSQYSALTIEAIMETSPSQKLRSVSS